MTDFHLKLGSLNFVFPSIERRLSNEIVFSNTIPRPVSGRGDDIYCMIVAFYLSDRYVDRQTVFFFLLSVYTWWAAYSAGETFAQRFI